MTKKLSNSGVTLVEALIGLIIFIGIIIPLLQIFGSSGNSSEIKDKKIACSLLTEECAIMYKNHKLPQPQRFVTVDNTTYEIDCTLENDGVLASWSMMVKKKGKSLAVVDGLLLTQKL